MLKHNIAILIAGGLLGAYVSLAAAGESAFPMGSDDYYLKGWQTPALTKYLNEREAAIQKEGRVLRGESFPRAAGAGAGWQTPALTKYLNERAAAIQKEARGDVYKTIKVEASTKNVTVEHFGTVKIVNDKGQSFVWTFDTVGEVVIPLKTIAPAGFDAGEAVIFVRHPLSHIQG